MAPAPFAAGQLPPAAAVSGIVSPINPIQRDNSSSSFPDLPLPVGQFAPRQSAVRLSWLAYVHIRRSS